MVLEHRLYSSHSCTLPRAGGTSGDDTGGRACSSLGVLAQAAMRQLLILVAHHPVKIGALVALLGLFYSFARVLALQFVAGALQDAILRYPKNFPHGFFLPLFHLSLAAAALAALYEDCSHGRFPSAELWKYVLPLPLTMRGKRVRLIGVPLYALGVACTEAVLVFRNPSMESVARALARDYLQSLSTELNSGVGVATDGTPMRKSAGMAWEMLLDEPVPREPTATILAYIRLFAEVLLATAVCVSYGIARFFGEPQHDGEELRDAARNDDTLGVKLLLARGMDTNTSSGDGTTALHICGQQSIHRAAQVLLEHGADANVRDRLGFTPLHWAVQMRREEVSTTGRLATIRILLHHGANPHQPDSCGITPLAIASRKENEASLGVLKEFLPAEELGGEGQPEATETTGNGGDQDATIGEGGGRSQS